MGIISIVLGLLAYVFYVVFLLTGGQPIWPVILAVVSSVLSIVFGAVDRRNKFGKVGLILGAIGLVIGIAFILYLTFSISGKIQG